MAQPALAQRLVGEPVEYVVSYLTLRQMIGWIGLLMPFAVRIGAGVFEHIYTTDSISAYYYTGQRDVFVSTLVLIGVLVTCYRTPAFKDNAAAIVAGLAAIGIGLFPMDPTWAPLILQKYPDMLNQSCYVNHGFLGYHFIFVATFFALSFYLVYFRFDAFTPEFATVQKQKRNKVYKLCGIGMLLAYLAIGALAIFARGASIFWPETLAVVSFGAAWLVKGQAVLADPAIAQGAAE
jgi:hypothetical protein